VKKESGRESQYPSLSALRDLDRLKQQQHPVPRPPSNIDYSVHARFPILDCEDQDASAEIDYLANHCDFPVFIIDGKWNEELEVPILNRTLIREECLRYWPYHPDLRKLYV
jgi:hypothetical protein